jgi:diguanylate cyclase (GGDEF)-like protein
MPGSPVAAPRDTEAILESIHEIAVPDEFPPAIADTEPVLSPVATIEELPASWRELLEQEQLDPRWFADAVTQGLRLQLAAYRQDVLAADAQARLELAQESPEALEQLVADFRVLHHEWLGKLLEGAEMLRLRRGRLGDAAQAAARLETLLYDHAARMEMLDCRIGDIDIRTDFAMGCRRLLAELFDLTAAIHLLRDDLTAAAADILKQQQMLRELPAEQRLDPLTGWLNRLGLEIIAGEPSEGFCSRQAVLIALDGLGKINAQFGTQAGDRTLLAFSQLLSDLLEGTCVSVKIVRLSGTRFLLLLDGMACEQATSLAEHLRQSLERATFDCQGTYFGLSARLGISTSDAGEPMEKLLARLAEAVDAAQIAGGNRCAMADAIGTQLVAPQIVPAISRRVTIGDHGELVVQLAAEGAACGTERLPIPPTEAAAEPAEEVSTTSCSSLVPQCTPDD